MGRRGEGLHRPGRGAEVGAGRGRAHGQAEEKDLDHQPHGGQGQGLAGVDPDQGDTGEGEESIHDPPCPPEEGMSETGMIQNLASV